MATKTFTAEELNYLRLCYVITHDVPEGLRKVFKQQWDARYQATHGQWLDVPKNATDFCNMESPRNRSRNARPLTIKGDTNQWDCTCLFYAILFSDCVGSFLSITIKKSVYELREIRNVAFAHSANGRLTDVEFEDAMQKILTAFNALGLDTTQVNAMKTQKSFLTDELIDIQQKLKTEKKRYVKFHSFCILPPKPSHETTDRADEVKRINHEMEKLRSTKKNETTVFYLSGNPGCGKSEIARKIGIKYFNELQAAELKFVFTFNASSIDTLLQSYVAFAASLSCDEDSITRTASSKDLSLEDKITQIKSLINPKLKNYSSWLIIVDNVNDLKLVSKYLPHTGEKTSGDGQILVTTQDSQSIPLDSYTYHYPSLKEGMKEEDAIALLSQISGTPGDRDTLLEIASALDFQPLALACAAVYMKQISDTKWEKYLLKLQEGKREATEKAYTKTASTYPSGMTAAVRLALERVVKDNIMMHAFQFFSFIANEPIPLNYVVQYVLNCKPDEDPDLAAAHISSSSLVLLSEDDLEMSKSVRIHQVVYHDLLHLFKNDELDISKLLSVFSDIATYKNFYDVTKEDIIATRPLAPHFVVISSHHNRHLLGQSDLPVDCLFKIGWICIVHGSFKASEIILNRCLSIQRREYNISQENNDKKKIDGKLTCSNNVSIALATTMKSLGHLYIQLRDFKKAQTHLEEALAIEERWYERGHPELAFTLNDLGMCLRQLGHHAAAQDYLNRALTIQEKEFAEKGPFLADILINLVLSLQSQEKTREARTYYERLFELQKTFNGNNYPQLGDTMNDIGVCLSQFNYHEKATPFYKKALEIFESVYHECYPYTAVVLKNLGKCLLRQSKNKSAQAYFERALSIQEKSDYKNDSTLADTLFQLGVCLNNESQYEKAQAYFVRALSIQEKSEHENDSTLVDTLSQLGVCLANQSRYEKAQAYFERGLSIQEKSEHKNDSTLADTLSQLGVCLANQSQYEKAQAYFERGLSIQDKGDHENDSRLATTLFQLGVCLKNQSQYEKAQAYFERSLSIQEKNDHENDSQLVTILSNIGVCLANQSQYEKAQAYFERGLSIQEKSDHENDSRPATTLFQLGVCLANQTQYEKAQAYFERALSIQEKSDHENDSRPATTLFQLGVCLNNQSQYEKAQAYFERALSIQEKSDHENDLQLVTILRNFGVCLANQSQYEKAQAYFERALSIQEKSDHKNDSTLADTLFQLGVCLVNQRQYKKAQAYFERALSIQEKSDHGNDSTLADTLSQLGVCLKNQSRYEKAQAYFERAQSIQEKRP